MDKRIYTVSELTREIKETLETNFPRLWVEGEVSNFKRHSSGHLYFTLKDENAQIKATMWRFRAETLLFRLEDGMHILVEGDLQVYEKGGYYQLIVQSIQPAGVGALQLAFEQLKKKLFAEGLFDEAHKKKIPQYPERIGVVTSPTGAAIRDIISVIHRRAPHVQLIIYPVRVQGEGAAEEIAQAIVDFNVYDQVDLLIVGRGGGSLEDLWPFNEEIVARSIYNSTIPIVSAVGHEVDFSISDFVADLRAPTPSAAAELVVRDREELRGILAYYREKLYNSTIQNIKKNWETVRSFRKSYAFRRPEDIVYQKMQRLDELGRKMQVAVFHRLKLSEEKIRNLQNQIKALSPTEVLKRGYSICYKDHVVVKDVKQIKTLDIVQVKLARGQFVSQVQLIGEGG
ncbi:MAG: exodeoxyribonuclease VII large subunit [Calditrichia bacterium]